jgi:putative sigma-54 modulation protein
MKIHVRGRNVEVTEVLRAHVERRLGLALGRFGEQIGPVSVEFSNIDPDGGVDGRCEIHVSLRPRSVRVEDRDANLFSAVDHAAGRLSRSVARALERERRLDGQPLAPAPRTSGGSKDS